MKKAKQLLPLIAEPANLYLASWKAAKGKRHAQEILKYQADLDTNLAELREEILSGRVTVGNYRYFKVYEPKERQICASAFREQVLHHALLNVCHDYFERAQIFDSYASRKGKGTYAAIARAKTYTHQQEWYLKLDVRKFFESIDHNVLKGQLNRLFKEEQLTGIFFQIIDSYAATPERGLPIGNLTSQYFANHFLSGLDHYIKEELKVKRYVRYMDDMVLWHSDKAELKKILSDIEAYLESNLHCQLKPVMLNRCKNGVPFLGYRVLPHHIRLLQKSKQRFIKKMHQIDEHYHSGEWTELGCQQHVLPLIAFTDHADSMVLRKNLLWRLSSADCD